MMLFSIVLGAVTLRSPEYSAKRFNPPFSRMCPFRYVVALAGWITRLGRLRHPRTSILVMKAWSGTTISAIGAFSSNDAKKSSPSYFLISFFQVTPLVLVIQAKFSYACAFDGARLPAKTITARPRVPHFVFHWQFCIMCIVIIGLIGRTTPTRDVGLNA